MTTKKQKAKIFKALGDEKRIEILELIKDKEECACTLLEKLGLTQSGLSYHMKILCESGIVISRQEGKWTYYQISKNGVLKISMILFDMAGIK
ncbi:transcriptional regulator, ArsR family [Campylobacter blaseri]|uniref:Transcriptional regulator n=1 Tax=Campylobacter blaseri TaxID=2042961 RepID=A0A2P8R193_9BACT|nr:metalloregulator ArsR/SmtB family transcription factor [Campylobacter blaseri]PSM52261.1 transcriptional regulator [Campylobacter blaseri]PSM54027.1 transcriptional regulator [Campylobacter blaseri]QKF85466.1 transcriptional regulator, ArsR family [Campylobacter blaseri]